MPVDPASLRIVHHPDPVLRRRADPVAEITDEVRAIAERMVVLMHEAPGIGLAAPQVGLPWRLFVAHVPPPPDSPPQGDETPPESIPGPLAFINPTIVGTEGPPEAAEEGCLSLPDIHGDVLRPPIVTVEATNIDGSTFTLTAAGLLARCIQHEFDHLNGVLIIDKFTQMSRLRNRSAVRQLERR